MRDLSVSLEEGQLNLRAGALIVKDGKLLLIWSLTGGHWYTVGGRIRFGEASSEAIRREIHEELQEKANLLTDGKLAVVNENFFEINGKRYHEIGYYFLFDGSALPDKLELFDCGNEYLKWVSEEELKTERAYPLFLKDGIPHDDNVRYCVTRE